MLANVRLAMKKNRSIAAVAIARKLAVRLWWMCRSPELCSRGISPR